MNELQSNGTPQSVALPDELLEELAKADRKGWLTTLDCSNVTPWEDILEEVKKGYRESAKAVAERFMEYLESIEDAGT